MKDAKGIMETPTTNIYQLRENLGCFMSMLAMASIFTGFVLGIFGVEGWINFVIIAGLCIGANVVAMFLPGGSDKSKLE